MRLRVARKVHIATYWPPRPARVAMRGDAFWPLPPSRHRHTTRRRSWRRIQRVHRRHFPMPVLRPISHRKRERP